MKTYYIDVSNQMKSMQIFLETFLRGALLATKAVGGNIQMTLRPVGPDFYVLQSNSDYLISVLNIELSNYSLSIEKGEIPALVHH